MLKRIHRESLLGRTVLLFDIELSVLARFEQAEAPERHDGPNEHGENDGRKFKHTKERLAVVRLSEHAFCRFAEAVERTSKDEDRRDGQRDQVLGRQRSFVLCRSRANEYEA